MKNGIAIVVLISTATLFGCGGSATPTEDASNTNNGQTVPDETQTASETEPSTPDNAQTTSGDTQTTGNNTQSPDYCDQFINEQTSYFCEDFSQTSPVSMVGVIPPMSFRDQTFRNYTLGELFELNDPTAETQHNNVVDLHTTRVDGIDFSEFATRLAEASKKWDITAHSRDGFVAPGTSSGIDDNYFWNERFLMADHGIRCGAPIDLSQRIDESRFNQRGFTFMQEFFRIPDSYNGDENTLSDYWLPEFELPISDEMGLHPVLRYEDMIYACADHLMTAAYGAGASKLSLTPNHLLDTSSGSGVVEFAVSTYRTAGRDYWQVDLTPLATHLQLPEGDVVADANGKAANGFNINTALDEGTNGVADIEGKINVFRTLFLKDRQFLINGNYLDPADPSAQYTRAQIANPGNPERLDVYATAPPDTDWVIMHTSYNRVMYDYLDGDNNPDITLHNVTDNRKRARFRLTVNEAPDNPDWNPELWDQVSLCMPDYGNGCVGEYVVPELPNELVIQFTHYAYNTTKSCAYNVGQPHDKPGAAFQSLCHPNTYHWDNFYVSPSKPFQIIKSEARTASADANTDSPVVMTFSEPAPANTKLRFTALTGGDSNGETTLQVSYDRGATWHRPKRQFEPENDFNKFRSYFTGTAGSEYIPAGTDEVWFKAENPEFRDAYWIRDASFWTLR